MFLVENGYLPSAGVTQLVECDLAKVDVAGSNPVSRSNLCLSNRAGFWPAASERLHSQSNPL